MAPSGVPVTQRPDGSHAADITACFFAAGANLPDSSVYVLLPSGLLHHLMWFTPYDKNAVGSGPNGSNAIP